MNVWVDRQDGPESHLGQVEVDMQARWPKEPPTGGL